MNQAMGDSSDAGRRFEALFDAHHREVLAYCARRIGAAEAKDACSETFLVAWRRIDDLPAPPKTLPYLYGIAARVVSNQRRTVRRRSRLHARLLALGAEPTADRWQEPGQKADCADVAAAVRRLGARDREIVMLYAWEDVSRDVIAEMMGMSRAAVDQRIHRAYKRLARMLKPALGAAATLAPPVGGEGDA
jgi:RNA polymerase sigma-70 factor (ECF subfamily)